MKISKLFHWLYCILMLFPFFGAVGIGLVWTFNTGSEVPTVPQKVDREIDFNQKVYNGNFYGTVYWNTNLADLSIIPGVQAHINANNTGSPEAVIFFNIHQTGTFIYEVGHIYLADFRLIQANYCSYLYFEYGYPTDPIIEITDMTSQSRKQFLITPTTTRAGVFTVGAVGSELPNLAQFSISNCMLFDLTQMFGEGYEPSIETFNQYFTESYYNTTSSTRMVLENYDTIYVPDNWTNYIWLPSFGGMGATIKSVFTYLIQTMFGISVATGTGGYIVLELLTYWLCISLIWLCFDVIMYVPLLIHRMLDKGVIS